MVGYQNLTLGYNYNYAVNTFVTVGKTKAEMTLGDIGVNENITYFGTVIQLLLDNGATATVEVEGLGEVDAMFTYADESVGAPEAGWYLSDDGGFEYPQNGRVIPLGQGYCVDCGDSEAALVFAGAVSREDTEVELSYNYNYTGNCSPKDITFGDLTGENLTYFGTVIQLLLDNGATATVEIEGLGEVDAMFTYADESVGAPEAGWYLSDDGGFEYPQNSRILQAGQGLLVDCGDTDAKLIIPAAL